MAPSPPNGITSTAAADSAERLIKLSDLAVGVIMFSDFAFGIIMVSDLSFLPGKLPRMSILAKIVQIEDVKKKLQTSLTFDTLPGHSWLQ